MCKEHIFVGVQGGPEYAILLMAAIQVVWQGKTAIPIHKVSSISHELTHITLSFLSINNPTLSQQPCFNAPIFQGDTTNIVQPYKTFKYNICSEVFDLQYKMITDFFHK